MKRCLLSDLKVCVYTYISWVYIYILTYFTYTSYTQSHVDQLYLYWCLSTCMSVLVHNKSCVQI